MSKFAYYLRKLVLILAGGTLLITASLGVASAAPPSTAQTITLSPAASAPSAKPGGNAKSSIIILNNGKTGYTVNIYTEPYHVEGADYNPQFTLLPGTTDASKWVVLSKNQVFVPAGHQVEVSYVVNVPANTTPGGYYAVIFVETQPNKNSQGVQTRSRVGDIQYITAQGKVKKGGSVKALPIPHVTTKSVLPLGLQVSNTGGLHFLSTTKITVTNLFGKAVFQANLQRFVLPQTVRNVIVNWNHTPPIGLYKVSRSATVNGQVKSLPSQWILIIHPIVIIIIAVIIILLVVVLFRLPRSRRRRKVRR